jgi:hypothetical protein
MNTQTRRSRFMGKRKTVSSVSGKLDLRAGAFRLEKEIGNQQYVGGD